MYYFVKEMSGLHQLSFMMLEDKYVFSTSLSISCARGKATNCWDSENKYMEFSFGEFPNPGRGIRWWLAKCKRETNKQKSPKCPSQLRCSQM